MLKSYQLLWLRRTFRLRCVLFFPSWLATYEKVTLITWMNAVVVVWYIQARSTVPHRKEQETHARLWSFWARRGRVNFILSYKAFIANYVCVFVKRNWFCFLKSPPSSFCSSIYLFLNIGSSRMGPHTYKNTQQQTNIKTFKLNMPWLIPHSSSILLRPGCSCHFCSKTVHCSSMNDCGKREKPYFWKILVCYLAYNSPIVGERQARVAEVLTLLLDRVCQQF